MTEQQLTTLLQQTAPGNESVDLTRPIMAAISHRQQQRLRLMALGALAALILTIALLLSLYRVTEDLSLSYWLRYWWENSEWNWASLQDSLELFGEILPWGVLTVLAVSVIISVWLTKLALNLRQTFDQLINNHH